MKIKTSELTGAVLDWAVARAEGVEYRYRYTKGGDYNGNTTIRLRRYSTDWSQSGPIIEREFIELTVVACGHDNPRATGNTWQALKGVEDADAIEDFGPTPLIAAMRCFIASKLGDEVDVPDELVKE